MLHKSHRMLHILLITNTHHQFINHPIVISASNHLVLKSPLVVQALQLLNGLLQRNELAHLLRGWVVTVTDVDGAGIAFLGAQDEDEVVQRELTCADLLLHLFVVDY